MERPQNIQNRMIIRPNKFITLFFLILETLPQKMVKLIHFWKNKNIPKLFSPKIFTTFTFFLIFPWDF